jgi:hypothetical protein
MENFLSLLVALICPVSMGLMMWFMRDHRQPTADSSSNSTEPLIVDPPRGNPIGRLGRSLIQHLGARR